jgi:methionine-rich copper-binding protein CopC
MTLILQTRPALAVALLLAAHALPVPGAAHALLERATPRVGQTVAAPPPEVAIDFTEQPEPAFSTIEVRDASGQRIDKGDVHVAADNPKRLVVSLAAAARGTLRVSWRVTSVDTHVTEGHYTFRVTGP